MTRRFTLLLIATICFCKVSFSQSLGGVINIDGTTASLPGINVVLNDGEYYTITDVNGSYVFSYLPKGTYILTASAIGYKTWKDSINYDGKSEVISNIYMVEDIIDLPVVEVNAHSSTGGKMGSLKLPGSSHYISRRELNEIHTTNPNDIFSRIPGVQVQEEDGFGLRPNIGLRGTGSERTSRITVMEDGVLSAPAPYAAPSAYYFPTIARMQGIEVRKGSSQIIHGPYTTGGIINLISTPIPQDFSGRVKIGGGSFGSRNLHAHIGNSQGQFSYGIETFQYSSDGFKNIDFSDSETGFDKKDYLAKFKWASKPGNGVFQSLQLKIGESREHSDETYLGLSYNDFLNDPYRRYAASQMDEMNTKQRQYSLHYLVNPMSGLFLQVTGYRNTFSRNWYKLDKIQTLTGENISIGSLLTDQESHPDAYQVLTGRSTTGSESLIVKANNRSYISEGIQAKANYNRGNHEIEMGIRIHRDEMDRFQWIDGYAVENGTMELESAGVKGTESNRIESASAIATYINYTTTIGKVKLNAGVRMEDISISREDFGKEDPGRTGVNLKTRNNEVNAFIPGIGMMYEVNSNSQFFGGIHRGFSPPGSSPETNPESSVNYELGYRMMNNKTFTSVVLFMNDFDNLLGADFASSGGLGTGDQFNGGNAMAKGVEIAFSSRQSLINNIWIPIEFQYTYTDARFNNSFESDFDAWGEVKDGDYLPYIAPHVWSFTTGFKSGKWSLTSSANYMGEMRITAGQGSAPDKEIINDRLILSVNANYSLSSQIDLSMGIHNLTDRVYAVATRPAGWRPGAPRNIVLGLEARF